MTRIPSLLAALSAGLLSLQLAAAQQLIPTSLPACAQSCALLQQASTSCMSNPSAASSCFCESALLAPIKANPTANVCNGFCSAADWTTIANWYTSTCANGGAAPVATLVTSATPAATQSGGPTIAQASGNAGTAVPTSGAGSNQAASGGTTSTNGDNPGNYSNGQQWWSTHYQWIIMLIVLLLVFTLLGVGGSIWYRRRQKSKARNTRTFAGGNASQWAPNGSTHDFNADAERQARMALAQQPGSMGGAAMVERGNSRKGKNPMASILRKKSVR